MKHVRKSVLLWYSAHEMYALVTAVEDYPRFLPWCADAHVLSRSDEGMKARLTLAFSGARHGFTTLNRHDADRAVQVSLVDGPFSLLEGDWKFLPLGAGGGTGDAVQQACKIEFDMRYEFANGPLEAVISPVFGRIANSLVDSFVRRAEQVYGPR